MTYPTGRPGIMDGLKTGKERPWGWLHGYLSPPLFLIPKLSLSPDFAIVLGVAAGAAVADGAAVAVAPGIAVAGGAEVGVTAPVQAVRASTNSSNVNATGFIARPP